MPFKSKAQQRFLFAKHPRIAKRWAEHARRTKKASSAVEGIPGGLAEGKPDSKYPPDELKRGIEIEMEHTSDPAKAKEIAKDHLEEHPNYYTALEKMEKRLEEGKTASNIVYPDIKKEKLGAAKPYRNRVDVVALDDKGRVYSGLYPDGGIGLFGGGIDGKETVLQAASREFKEESGRKLTGVQRLSVAPFTESKAVRAGWAKAGKTDRIKKYRGSRTSFAFGKVVPGNGVRKSEPSAHIKDIKFRSLEDAIALQEKAIAKAKPGHKGLSEKRLQALREAFKVNMEKKSLDDSQNPSNTLTTTKPAERSSLFTQTRSTTCSSMPETKPISDGTEPGAFDGVTKTSAAQRVAERLLELYADKVRRGSK